VAAVCSPPQAHSLAPRFPMASPRPGTPKASEPAFVGAGQAPGLEIWRIENLAPVKLPGPFDGKLYTGEPPRVGPATRGAGRSRTCVAAKFCGLI
jgi:hypothetical protein